MTIVDRATRCIIAQTPDFDTLQAMLDASANTYFSDAFPTYRDLMYFPATHSSRNDKRETYSVEGVNADLRHYLARLARKSRCFSRSLQALQRALQLFVFCYNHRQLKNRAFPRYAFHLIDFL